MKIYLAILLVLLSTTCLGKGGEIEQYKESIKEFESMLFQSRVSGNQDLPGNTQKSSASLIMRLTNTSILSEFGVDDIPDLVKVCDASASFFGAYLMSNLVSVVTAPGTIQEKAERRKILIESNVKKYQPEILSFHQFSISCTARQASLMNKFWQELDSSDKSDTRINGIKQFQTGIAQQVIGALEFILDPVVSNDYRKKILSSLVEAAPNIVEALPLNARLTIYERYRFKEMAGTQDIKELMVMFLKTFQDKKCIGVCMV